jgi:hypothetical protein
VPKRALKIPSPSAIDRYPDLCWSPLVLIRRARRGFVSQAKVLGEPQEAVAPLQVMHAHGVISALPPDIQPLDGAADVDEG